MGPTLAEKRTLEIAGMYGSQGRPVVDREKLTAKADELDRTIRKLVAMRNGLRHAAVCPAPDHFACPTFQKMLRIEGARPPRR